ncbi:hypothetical protein HY639_05815 [Candidatus Woesearchaeota archaeon]|nr:hypothetical protein [Candidatus Woesearchaeota archaeon]
MSLESRLRNAWGHALAKASYPISGNFPEGCKDNLVKRFGVSYNPRTATVVTFVTNPLLYSAIGGLFLGPEGIELGFMVGMAETALRALPYACGQAPGSIAGSMMTAEEGTTWAQRRRTWTRRFVAKWSILIALGSALHVKASYDAKAFQEKYKHELDRIQKQQVLDKEFEPLLYRKESIPIIAQRIRDDKDLLSRLPSVSGKDYVVESQFLDYYQAEVKPTLDTILKRSEPLPRTQFGYGSIAQEPIFFDVLGFLGLGMLIFGAGWQKRFRYAGISFYNMGRSLYDAVDHRRVGLVERVEGGCRSLYHGTAYLGHVLLAQVNLLGVVVCLSVGMQFVVGQSNSYNPITKQIRVTPSSILDVGRTKEDLAIVLAHENTHYYQDRMNWPTNSLLQEGHARAIERMCAQDLANKTKDDAWLRGPVQRELVELKSVYYTLCMKYAVAPDATLLGEHDVDAVTKAMYEQLAADGHAKGIAVFRIAEHEHGQKIYDDVLHNNFDALTVPAVYRPVKDYQ